VIILYRYNPDNFRISKSYAVMDIDDMINTIRQMPDKEDTPMQMASYFANKNHPFDDFEGTAANPFEEEAVEMAIRSGKVNKETGRIIHAGRTSSNEMNGQIQNRRYDVAREEALEIGKELMNIAADKQNEINKERFVGYTPVPRPWDADGKLNATYKNGVSGTLKN